MTAQSHRIFVSHSHLDNDFGTRFAQDLRLTLLSDFTALLAKQGQWAKVQQRAREALRLVHNDPGWLAIQQQAQSKLTKQAVAHISKGDALYDLEGYEEAIAAYDQAILLDPNDAFNYHDKGDALERLGKKREAQQAYAKARQLGYQG